MVTYGVQRKERKDELYFRIHIWYDITYSLNLVCNRRVMKEPKITKMDWRALGYWPVYKDGKLVWEKEENGTV